MSSWAGSTTGTDSPKKGLQASANNSQGSLVSAVDILDTLSAKIAVHLTKSGNACAVMIVSSWRGPNAIDSSFCKTDTLNKVFEPKIG